MLVRWNPWNELSRIEREMSMFFDARNSFASLGRNGDAQQQVAWQPAVDIHEDAQRVLVVVDLPGVEQKDVEIAIENNVLTLRGERKREQKDDGEGYRRFERSYGSYARSFTLPTTIEAEKVTAEMRAGVLTLTLPKKPEAQPRQIKVNVAS